MRKLKVVRKWQRASLYKKSLTLFTILLVILAGITLVYVRNSMVLYERNLVDNYINYLASSGKLTKNISNDMFSISKYEKKNAKITDGINKLYKSNDLKIKKNNELSKDEVYAYDLYNEDKLISTVSIKSVKSYKRMAILTINEWDIVDYKNYFEDGIYSYEITIPSNYKLYINGKLVNEDVEEKDVPGLERLTSYIEISKTKTYNINNLVYEADIKIKDEKDNEVLYKKDKNKIIVTKDFKELKSLDDAKEYLKDDFSVLDLAKNWSLFLTNDYSSGFTGLSKYLINGSYMYDMAKSWSTGVDRTFVSSHRLKNPIFTNERIENFVIYNDNAFSCEVYLEKNMVVSGNDKVDVMHDRLYFIYYDGGYKLVNMEALTE